MSKNVSQVLSIGAVDRAYLRSAGGASRTARRARGAPAAMTPADVDLGEAGPSEADSRPGAADPALDQADRELRRRERRWPLLPSIALIVALSLGLWLGLFALVGRLLAIS